MYLLYCFFFLSLPSSKAAPVYVCISVHFDCESFIFQSAPYFKDKLYHIALLPEAVCSFPNFPDSQNNHTETIFFKSLVGQLLKHVDSLLL